MFSNVFFAFTCLAIFVSASQISPQQTKVRETLENKRNLVAESAQKNESTIKDHLKQQQGKDIRVNEESVKRLIRENANCLKVKDPVRAKDPKKGENILKKQDVYIKHGIIWLALGKAIEKLKKPITIGTATGQYDTTFEIIFKRIQGAFANLDALKHLEVMIKNGEVSKKFVIFGDYEMGKTSTTGAAADPEDKECLGRTLLFLNEHGGVEKARAAANEIIEKELNVLADEMIKSPNSVKIDFSR